MDNNILPRDQNHIPAAGFESSTTPGLVLPGRINEITGRILVNATGGGGFPDPLTTNGDIIARISGVTTRLPQGADGTVLGVVAGLLQYFTPSGSGDMVLANAQTNTGAKTFNDTTLLLRNVANTFNGSFLNTNTANRVYTLQNRAGTLADDTDLALKANLVSPSFTTPTLGVALATSINGLIITTTTGTLTLASSKVFTVNNTITLAGTDATVMTFPTTSATIARTDSANTFTGVQTFSTPIATTSVATMSATVGGGVPTPPNNTTTFLRGDGTFATPAVGGDMVLASAQTNTGAKTFNATTLLLRNVANSFNGSFTNTNTADRIYTLPDAAGTVASISFAQTFTGVQTFVAPVLGTPTSATLTNATGLPISGLVNSTSLALGLGTIELGNASDTTLSRSAAGVLAVEGVVVPTISSTSTFTNKRVNPRTNSTTNAATLAPDLSAANVYFRTTQTETLTISAPIGTPVIGETLYLEVSSVAAQTLTINATYVVFGAAFPASTTAGKSFMLTCTFNGTNWRTTWASQV